MCQRPKRASFISTEVINLTPHTVNVCQRPKRASFISTLKGVVFLGRQTTLCQRPKRASFISTVPPGPP